MNDVIKSIRKGDQEEIQANFREWFGFRRKRLAAFDTLIRFFLKDVEGTLSLIQERRSRLNNIVIGLVVFASACVGAAFFYYHRAITEPLVRLTRAAEEISRGNMVLKIDGGTGRDEIGTLARTLSQMTENLVGANAELEREVAVRKRAEAEVAARNRDLETLLYVISHDLREPLRAIENFGQMVHDRYVERLDDKGRDFLHRIVRGSRRMTNLLDDILTLSRAQRVEIPSLTVNGETIVRKALKRLEGKILETSARIQVVENLPELRADPTWATQAIYNLVANALKFVKPGEAPAIEIAGYQGGAEVGIVVRDRGPGVPRDQAERIFLLFQRAVGREVEGTGAGLAIVKQVAERHGGRAWVQPREGGGSEFVITFGAPGGT